MRSLIVRMSDELLAMIRAAAARETIRRNQQISMNTLIVEILTEALSKKKKGKQ